MIVKNEQENLPGCLESVRGLVDEIVVVDTGSTDATVEIAESFGSSVYHVPWQGDFAVARNQSISRATGDWIFYLDADERVDPCGVPDCIRKAASHPGVDAWSVSIKSHKFGSEACDTTLNIRLFRRLPGTMFENEVHERIEPSLHRAGARVAVAPFIIDHFGYKVPPDELRAKLERNLELSQKHLDRQPDDPYCLYYVGITLLLLDRRKESRDYFRKAFEVPGLPLFLNTMLCNLAAYLELLDGNADGALSFAAKSLEMVPRQNTAYLLSGLAHFRKSDFAAALPSLARACDFLALPPEKRESDLSQEYAFIDEAEFQKLIGTCCAETERYSEAVSHFLKYMELRGSDPEILRSAGICSINIGDFKAGIKFLEQAESLGAPRSQLLVPMALAHLKMKNFDRAESLLREAETHPDQDAQMILKVKDILKSGKPPGPTGQSRCAGISLCMIVKNEEQRLSGCLESVRGMVDEVIVVDTGSSDKTVETAKSLGAKVFSHAWPGDFSKARNESLRHATGEWVLFLDADERLDSFGDPDCLRKAASMPGTDAFRVPIFNREPGGKREPAVGGAIRFFRNSPGMRFRGRVHEGVDLSLIEAGATVAHANFAVDHYGYGQDPATVEGKYRRNLDLLEAELAEDPENAKARYHLGLTNMALGREHEARAAFDRALSGKDLTPWLEAMVLNMKAYHHLRAAETDQALEAASRSFALVSRQNTGRLLKGLALFRKGSHGEALPLLLESYRYVSIPPQERKSDISFEDSIDKSDLIEVIGTCFSETGNFKEAAPFLKMAAAIKEAPDVLERLGVCLLNTGEFAEAARYLDRAVAAGASPVSLALPLTFISFGMGDFKRAAKHFLESKPRDRGEISVAFQLVRTMADVKGFRPYLKDCLRSKQDLFRRAFPDEFSKLIAKIGAQRPEALPEKGEL